MFLEIMTIALNISVNVKKKGTIKLKFFFYLYTFFRLIKRSRSVDKRN